MIISPVEYLLWAINRNTYVAAITAVDLRQYGWDGKLATTDYAEYPPVVVAGEGVQIDEIGQLLAKNQPAPPAPPVMVEGWHGNFRVYIQELYDALAAFIETMPIVQADHGVPAAAMDPNGMKWLIPDGIATRRRIWA